MDRILDYLSDYVTSLDYNQIPTDAVEKTKGLIVDTIGCALGGYDSFPSQVAVELAQTVTAKRSATVLVNGHSTTPDLAAFANGVMIRYLDFNDGYTSIDSGHPSDAIAAVLPLAEMRHATGREFIASTVLAYETFCRLCDAVEVRNRGYDHVTLGVISAGVGAARALGLDKEKTAEAISLSLVPNVSLHQTRIGTVSMWKGCAFANASRNAVFAAQLAEKGLTGPADIFDGREGFGKVITGDLIELAPFGGGRDALQGLRGQHQALPPWPLLPDGDGSGLEGEGASVRGGRHRGDSRVHAGDGCPHHGRGPGKVASRHPRDGGPLHALHRGGDVEVWRRGCGTL